MKLVIPPLEIDNFVILAPRHDFREPDGNGLTPDSIMRRYCSSRTGVIRPNHDQGCIYRYGGTSEDGEMNCSCPYRDSPSMVSRLSYPPVISENLAHAKIVNWSKPPFSATRYESVDEAYRVASEAGEPLYRDDLP